MFPINSVPSLHQLLEDAQEALSIYKDPDLEQLREQLNPVLKAAGLGSTGNDSIVAVEFYAGMQGYYEIRTEWSARCCAQTSEYRLPLSIVVAADPVQAAQAWHHTQAMEKAQTRIDNAQRELKSAMQEYEKLQNTHV